MQIVKHEYKRITSSIMNTKPIIIFPFGGYRNNQERKNNFKKIVNICKTTVTDQKPLIIVNRDTLNNKIKPFTQMPI